MPARSLPLCLALISLSFIGCSTVSSRMKDAPEAFASASPGQQDLMRQGRLAVGFSQDMVFIAVGKPDHVLTRNDGYGPYEVWNYFRTLRSSKKNEVVSESPHSNPKDAISEASNYGPPAYAPSFKSNAQPRVAATVTTTVHQDRSLQVFFREGKVVSFNGSSVQ